MNSVNDKINELFDKSKELVKEKKYDEAKEIIKGILILDETNEEALYVLKKIEEVSTINKPNLFWENKMLKIQPVWIYVTDMKGQNVDIKNITPTSFIVPIGKYKVTVKSNGYTTKYDTFEIKSAKTKVLIKTYHTKMYLGNALEIVTWEE